MVTVGTNDLRQNLLHYCCMAERCPVEIRGGSTVIGYLISPEDFERAKAMFGTRLEPAVSRRRPVEAPAQSDLAA